MFSPSLQNADTGASSGIGAALAKLCTSRGATVALADVNQEGLDKVISSLPHNEKHMTTIVDVRKYDQVESWVKSIVSKYGRLDGAANLAGVHAGEGPLHETPLDQVRISEFHFFIRWSLHSHTDSEIFGSGISLWTLMEGVSTIVYALSSMS